MRRALPVICLVLTITVIAVFYGDRIDHASTGVWIGSAIALLGAGLGAAIPRAAVRSHTAVAAGLMATVGVFAAMRAFDAWPFVWDAMPDARYAAFIATLCAATAIGLVARQLWARWLALAFAAASAIGSALNLIGMQRRDEVGWLAAIGAVGGLTIISQLVRPEVTTVFIGGRNTVWASRDWVVRLARWAAIANFAASSMLMLYALAQPVAPATVWSAFVIAPVIATGSVLVLARRSAGVLVLGVGGLALLAHTVASLRYVAIAWDVQVVGYYACFWVPAAVLGLVACVAAAVRAR